MNTPRKVMIGTPCYDALVNQQFMTSVLQLLCTEIPNTSFAFTPISDSSINRARSRLASKLMQSDCTHLLFIDADIAFAPDQVIRLLNADREVCSALYPLKTLVMPDPKDIDPSWNTTNLLHSSLRYVYNCVELDSIPEDGFFPVLDAGTGFMLIKREVFEKFQQHYPELKCHDPDPLFVDLDSWAYFIDMVDPTTKHYLTEDYAFCRRWQKIGGKVWVDLHSKLSHYGRVGFEGDFIQSTYLKQQNEERLNGSN